jgi:hypothetical protein
MARYQLLRIGVWDNVASQRIIPQSGEPWRDYQAWLAAGNIPDPYIPPTPAPETLAHAKRRRAIEIKHEGLSRMQTRFGALRDFETVQLLREVILSVAPAARQLTADFTWLQDTFQAGKTALAAVEAATTVAQVDAVTPSWPAL